MRSGDHGRYPQLAAGECRTSDQQGFWFHGGRFLDLDRARLFYQWEFALNWQITDDDGWHDPDFPLVSVEVDIFKVPPQDMDGRPAGGDHQGRYPLGHASRDDQADLWKE